MIESSERVNGAGANLLRWANKIARNEVRETRSGMSIAFVMEHVLKDIFLEVEDNEGFEFPEGESFNSKLRMMSMRDVRMGAQRIWDAAGMLNLPRDTKLMREWSQSVARWKRKHVKVGRIPQY